MMFKNYTGRVLTILAALAHDSLRVEFPPDGPAPKFTGFNQRGKAVKLPNGLTVTCSAGAAGESSSAPVVPTDLTGMPVPEDGVVFIVPLPVEVAGVALGRKDLLRMGPGVFDATGVQVGAVGFQSSLTEFQLPDDNR